MGGRLRLHISSRTQWILDDVKVRVRPGRLRKQRVRDSVPPLWADGGGKGVKEWMNGLWEGNERKNEPRMRKRGRMTSLLNLPYYSRL